MSTRDKLATLVVNDEGFLFDNATGSGYVANPTALALVRGLQAGLSHAALAEELSSTFDVAPADAAADVAEFAARLKSLHLA